VHNNDCLKVILIHVVDGIVDCCYGYQGQPQFTVTCSQLHKKAERIGALLMDKGRLNTGDHVALIYGPSLDLIAAFYGCLFVGEQRFMFTTVITCSRSARWLLSAGSYLNLWTRLWDNKHTEDQERIRNVCSHVFSLFL